VRAAHHELADPAQSTRWPPPRRLPALRIADPVCPLHAERVEQADRGPRLDGAQRVAVDDGASLAEVGRSIRTQRKVLPKVNGAWKVASRTIVLDASVLLDKNLRDFL